MINTDDVTTLFEVLESHLIGNFDSKMK